MFAYDLNRKQDMIYSEENEIFKVSRKLQRNTFIQEMNFILCIQETNSSMKFENSFLIYKKERSLKNFVYSCLLWGQVDMRGPAGTATE